MQMKTLRYEVGTYNFACEILDKLSVPVDHIEVSGVGMRYRFYNANKEKVAEYNERKNLLYVFSDYKLPHNDLVGKEMKFPL